MKAPVEIEFMGCRVRAVGNKLYRGKPMETDHEFYLRVLQTTFHPNWYKRERQKPSNERHIVARWYESYCQFTNERTTEANKTSDGWSALPSGDVQAFLTLAYDLYCCAHTLSLPKKLVDRLKERNSFQGARYELAVASLLVQLDYKIEYLKSKDEKACEFVARRPLNDECFGVEAKSRHRSGVFHQPGSVKELEEVKVGITGKLNEAISQRPKNIPFIIFIDLNLPWSGKEGLEKPWLDDIRSAIDHQGQISEKSPEKFNALFLTNYSYHYEGKMVMDNSGKYAGDLITIIPRFAEHPFKQMGNLADLSVAAHQYGYVPDRNDGMDLKKLEVEKLRKRVSILQDFARFMIGSKNTNKKSPTITSLLVCREIISDEKVLHFKYVGHTLISLSGQGMVNMALYVEGHWFTPPIIKLRISIFNESGEKVCDPPLMSATVSENGIFETKLIMENAFPFRPGRYEVIACVENGPSAVTELILIS